MTSDELNIKYIREKTGLVKDDELIPIILEMIKESYKAGLCQSEYDNTMGLIEEKQELIDYLKEQIRIQTEKIESIKSYKSTKYLVALNARLLCQEILSKIEKSRKA